MAGHQHGRHPRHRQLNKEGAAPTWKKGYGYHPLAAWCPNTRECLHMLLGPGNAGSNTLADHKEVLAAALKQVPVRFRRKVLVRGRSQRAPGHTWDTAHHPLRGQIDT